LFSEQDKFFMEKMAERVLSDATESSESEDQFEGTINVKKMDSNAVEKLSVRIKWALRSHIYNRLIGDCLATSEVRCTRLLNHHNALD
jgi:hypothetical protein